MPVSVRQQACGRQGHYLAFPRRLQLHPGLGWNFLLPLFAAAILGGVGNMYGALIGGLIMGVVQQVSTAFMLPTYKPAVAFIIMIILLLFRPQGIFGGRTR